MELDSVINPKDVSVKNLSKVSIVRQIWLLVLKRISLAMEKVNATHLKVVSVKMDGLV